jgi:hypothetical protein
LFEGGITQYLYSVISYHFFQEVGGIITENPARSNICLEFFIFRRLGAPQSCLRRRLRPTIFSLPEVRLYSPWKKLPLLVCLENLNIILNGLCQFTFRSFLI